VARPTKKRADEHESVPFSGDPRNVVICYNRACPDYRRERSRDEPCACRRTSVREPMLSIDIEQ
jgi:hypothetical protein